MEEGKSLIELAEQAGFVSIYNEEGVDIGINKITSDDFKHIYFRYNEDTGKSRPESTTVKIKDTCYLDIFAMKDPVDDKSCALYQITVKDIAEQEERGNLDLDYHNDKRKFISLIAIAYLEDIIERQEK